MDGINGSSNGNGNGNGGAIKAKEFQREMELQEKLTNVEHAKMEKDISEIKDKQKTNSEYFHGKLKDVADAVDSKHKFILTIVVTIMGTIMVMSYTADDGIKSSTTEDLNRLSDRIYDLEMRIGKSDEILHQNDRLLDAIVSGEVVLSGEMERHDKLLEYALNNKRGD